MTELNRRALLRTAALAGMATAAGLAGGLTTAAPAGAADSTDVANGPWLVSVGQGVLRIDPDRRTPQRLLSWGDEFSASPDGRWLAFVAGDLFLMDLATGAVRQVTDRAGVRHQWPTWSPDGTRVAVTRNGEALDIIDVATGAAEEVISGHPISRPDWSRDGSMFAFWWRSRSEGPQLRTLTLATGKMRRIYLPEAAGETFGWPAFLPNNQRVVFCTNRWTRDTDVPGGAALASVRVDGTGLKRLTDETRFYMSPVYSPDGRYCAALSVPETNPYPDGGNIIVATDGFGASWWIPGDEYDYSTRLTWARAL
ncbi:hypothetical protein ABZ570_00025 [Micromonospora sp. NPDC007271]|uniref:TolB family protein n=1 Tax=Micromonospora sp. NPDC007271 TaxID=3154587 RepID=UPI0033D9240E